MIFTLKPTLYLSPWITLPNLLCGKTTEPCLHCNLGQVSTLINLLQKPNLSCNEDVAQVSGLQ